MYSDRPSLPAFVIAPSSPDLTFPGTATGPFGSLTITLANPSLAVITIDKIRIEGPNVGDFNVPSQLKAIGSLRAEQLRVVFVFDPKGAGTREASLIIEHRGQNSPTKILLRGAGPEGKGPPSPDFDGDGQVGFSDFFAFADVFGKRQGDAGFDAKFDLDGSGDIGFDDFFQFSAAFGK